MDVKGNFQLNPLNGQVTAFRNKVSFGGAHVGGQFQAQGTCFEEVNCSGFKAGMEFLLTEVAFFGPLYLADASFLDLIIKGQDDSPPLSELHLERSVVKRRLTVENITIKRLTASHLRVDGPTTLQSIEIKDHADLRHGNHKDLRLVQVTWPSQANEVLLDGLTYEDLSKREDGTKPDWKEVLDLLNLSRFNTKNYSQLEAYLQRGGEKNWADRIYINCKRRDLRQKRYWRFRLSNWAIWIFWDLLTGYGRKPARTLLLIIPLVVAGAFLFEPQFEAKFLKDYSSFKSIIMDYPPIARGILSIDRFLPGVDLGIAKYWHPSQLCLWTWLYWHFIKIMGWITIPIALAAIYTRIK